MPRMISEDEARELRARFRRAVAGGMVATAMADPPDVCYSRGMTNETAELIRAKRDMLAAVVDSFKEKVASGEIDTIGQAETFLCTYLEGVESILPQPGPEPVLDPYPLGRETR